MQRRLKQRKRRAKRTMNKLIGEDFWIPGQRFGSDGGYFMSYDARLDRLQK